MKSSENIARRVSQAESNNSKKIVNAERIRDQVLGLSIRVHGYTKYLEMIVTGEASAKLLGWEIKLLRGIINETYSALAKMPEEFRRLKEDFNKEYPERPAGKEKTDTQGS